MLLRHAIGSALRRIRLENGLTLRDVAVSASISVPYLSEIERGRKEPSSEVLAVVARVLGLSLVDLLDLTRVETLRGTVVVDLTSRRDGTRSATLLAAGRTAPDAAPARHEVVSLVA